MTARSLWTACALCLLFAGAASVSHADSATGAQRKAAEEYLAATASGSAQALAFAIHPDELAALRERILKQLRDENEKADNTIRTRLFGVAAPLNDLERLTPVGFFTRLADRLVWRGRVYESLSALSATPDSNGVVHLIVRGKQPRERGRQQVIELVTIMPYGKDWKSVLPLELAAQIEDLIDGRSAANVGAASAAPSSAKRKSENTPEIRELLDRAERVLLAEDCEGYYSDVMSPNFQRLLSKTARETLVKNCHNSLGTRETLLAAVRLVRELPPAYEYDNKRAVYDVSDKGLPFDRYVLELINRRWYVAE
ncbi:MAG: hypothetical protein R3E77_16310 [Steroidobacteraceae bacterium]